MPCDTCGATLDDFLCGNVSITDLCDECSAACGDILE